MLSISSIDVTVQAEFDNEPYYITNGDTDRDDALIAEISVNVPWPTRRRIAEAIRNVLSDQELLFEEYIKASE